MDQEKLSTISFKALSGAKDESPFAYLLFIDNFKILLDCGWTEDFDESQIETIKEIAPEINAVLISHCTMEHIGALPYLVQRCGLTAPVYATIPIVAFGPLVIYDCYCNILEEIPFKLFNANDIEVTFNQIVKVGYEQEIHLDNGNIVVTAYRAGRTIGGSVWRIVKGENEILYTNSIYRPPTKDFGDRILDGFEPASQWHPTLWILDARGGKEADRLPNLGEFFGQIAHKLRNQSATVLIPVDGITRTFEVLWHLNEYWKKYPGLSSYPICYLSHVSDQIMTTVNTFTDWLHHDIVESVMDKSGAEHPLDMKHIERISSIEDLPPDMPCIVVATSNTLEHGFSRQVFMNIGERPNSLICVTTTPPKGSLIDEFLSDNTHRDLEIVTKWCEVLDGQKLLDYKEEQERKLANIDDFEEDDDDDVDDENAEEAPVQRVASTAAVKREFQFKTRTRASVTDYGVAIKAEDYAKGVLHQAVINDEEAARTLLQPTHKSALQEPKDVPCEYLEKTRTFRYNATVMECNFDARCTMFQIKTFLQRIPPAHVIIIGGSFDSTMKLHDVIHDNIKAKISTPSVGETVQLTMDQSSMRIGLSRALYNTLDFRKVDEFNEVAFLNAVLVIEETSGYLSAKPVEHECPHHANFVGKIKMQDLRRKLQEANVKTTADSGRLICGKVEIRQIDDSTLSVEGPMCTNFIKVRNVIQEMLPMV